MKRLIIGFALFLPALSATAEAQRLPGGFSQAVYVGGFSGPTAMAFAPDGRLFVVQQGGAVRVVSAAGALLRTPFHAFTVDSSNERGLLGIAFDPNFGSGSDYVYFYYTRADGVGSRNRVDRLTANGDAALLGSGINLFKLPYLGAGNHNGGALHFGPDGKLYVGVGENAVPSLSQSMTSRLGKMLRYNSDGSIPTDNPFYNSASGNNRAIWALGLRNPFTFAFDPVTGTMHVNDVGSGSFEEINLGEAGANHGWPDTEGPHSDPDFEQPLYSYPNAGSNCAITGGTFYNPAVPVFPAGYVGDYFFADLCASEIYVRDAGSGSVTTFADPALGGGIVDLQIGPDGALYYLSRGSNSVYRIAFTPDPAAGELAVNGSFELDTDGDGIPNNWKPSAVSTRRLCDARPYVTEGACALRVSSSSGGGSVSQKISGYAIFPGTTLDVSAMVTGANVPAGAQIKIKVINASGTDLYTLPIPSGSFATQAISHPPIAVDEQGPTVKISIVYPNGGGKLHIDEVAVFATAPE